MFGRNGCRCNSYDVSCGCNSNMDVFFEEFLAGVLSGWRALLRGAV